MDYPQPPALRGLRQVDLQSLLFVDAGQGSDEYSSAFFAAAKLLDRVQRMIPVASLQETFHVAYARGASAPLSFVEGMSVYSHVLIPNKNGRPDLPERPSFFTG